MFEPPPAIYASMPRPAGVVVIWVKDVRVSAAACAGFGADRATACYVDSYRMIVFPKGLDTESERLGLEHEWAHAKGWRHPAPYTVMSHYRAD